MAILMPMEQRLGRTINPTLYTPADWLAKRDAGNSFVLRVAQQDKNNLISGPSPSATISCCLVEIAALVIAFIRVIHRQFLFSRACFSPNALILV